MPIPAVIGAAAVAGGAGMIGGYLGNRSARKESARNRKFQERMRNTQWQAGVADMEKAGVNPALAYSQGPASSPMGSTAAQQDAISPAVSSAMQMKRLSADVKMIDAQTRKEEGLADSAEAGGELAQFRTRWMKMVPGGEGRMPYLDMLQNELGQSGANLASTGAGTRKDILQGDVLEPMAEIAREMGVALPVLIMMMKGLPGIAGAGIKAGAAARLARKGKFSETVTKFSKGVRRSTTRSR